LIATEVDQLSDAQTKSQEFVVPVSVEIQASGSYGFADIVTTICGDGFEMKEAWKTQVFVKATRCSVLPLMWRGDVHVQVMIPIEIKKGETKSVSSGLSSVSVTTDVLGQGAGGTALKTRQVAPSAPLSADALNAVGSRPTISMGQAFAIMAFPGDRARVSFRAGVLRGTGPRAGVLGRPLCIDYGATIEAGF